MSLGEIVLWAVSLMTPAVMIVAGAVMRKYPPKKISNAYGYRTRRSQQSQEAWDAAQKISGTNMFFYGVVLLTVVPVVILGIGTAADPYVSLLAIVAAEIILTAFPILAVERQLKKQFPR